MLLAFSLSVMMVVVLLMMQVDGCCLLRVASQYKFQLLTRPVEWPPTFDYHHHLLDFVINDMMDGLKTLPVKAHVKNIATMCTLPLSFALTGITSFMLPYLLR